MSHSVVLVSKMGDGSSVKFGESHILPRLVTAGKIGVINPDKSQIKQCLEKWGESGKAVEAVSGSPYGDFQEIIDATNESKGKDVDVIVMDCIGYNVKMKNTIREITGKPVILARVIREMLD